MVSGEVTISDRITVSGDVHLILEDGAKLTASSGINVKSGNSLTIYAQSDGADMGVLNAEADLADAGIGGSNSTSGTVTIHGGAVTANGGRSGAGIGGGGGLSGGTVTIYGGTVTATGGYNGAGIGGSGAGAGGTVTIRGGTVTATGGEYGAGIGGGLNGRGGTVTITGGSVKAVGQSGAEAIGRGAILFDVPSSGTLTDGSGNSVSLVTLTLNGVSGSVDVTAIAGLDGYGLNDVKTLDGKLYLYLSSGASATSITAGGVTYPCSKNNTFYASHSLAGSACEGGTCSRCSAEVAATGHTADTYTNGFRDCCGEYQPAKWNETAGFYEIGNAGQLYWFAAQVNGGNYSINGKLTANIVVNEDLMSKITVAANGTASVNTGATVRNWTPIIGTSGYTGIFDGAGHTVSGLYFNNSSTGNVGLFGSLTVGGTVQNVGVIDSYFCGGDNVGGVAGYLSTGYFLVGNVINCYNTGIVTGSSNVGGVAGNNGGTATGCYNTGTVTGSSNVGGVIGGSSGTVTNCYYLADSETDSIDGTTFKTADQFASGEVTYLLNGSTSEGTLTWKQTCGVGTPAFSGLTVYQVKNCGGNLVYANTATVTSEHDYTDNNGFCTVCDAYQPAKWNETDGVYEIGNAGQLYWFAAQVNGGSNSIHGKLTDDIEVNPGTFDTEGNYTPKADETVRNWILIGNAKKWYRGTFNGNGHTISGLYHNNGTDYVGLFGVVSYGTVKNVGVINSYFKGVVSTGGIAGRATNATITNCYNTSTVAGGYCGGIVSYIAGSTVSNCYNTGMIDWTGSGIAGEKGGTVTNCYYLEGTADGGIYGEDVTGSAEVKTLDQFNSGEVTYLLNGSTSTPEEGSTLTWYQTCGTGYPDFSGLTVYQIKGCSGNPIYTNEAGEDGIHIYSTNGFCEYCDGYEPAKLVNGVYEIGNAGQLYWFAAYVNGYTLISGGDTEDKSDDVYSSSANAKLIANIVVNPGTFSTSGTYTPKDGETRRDWTPIGTDNQIDYCGTFDGQNFTVSGLYFSNRDVEGVGLFGQTGSSATVSNVGVENSYFYGKYDIGGVVGYSGGTVTNC